MVLQQIDKFFLVILIAILSTRIWVISLFYFLGDVSQVAGGIVNDPFHHYHLGLVLVVITFFFRKNNKSIFMSAIGLGIFFEEWAVFLKDLGFNTNHLYLTKIDFFIILSLVVLIYIFSKAFFINKSLINN